MTTPERPVLLQRRWIVNGQPRSVSFPPLARLLDVLRDQLDLISLKEGCGEGECGACSFLLGGELRLACLTAAAGLEDGAELTTAEGLGQSTRGQALRQAFDAQGAVQCGYCTPGMLLGSFALLAQHPRPTAEQVRKALAGHLCRCTGYSKIVAAVSEAAEQQEQDEP